MTVRTATPADHATLLTVYARARQYMAETGNPKQWGTTTPTPEAITADILAGNLYVLTSGTPNEEILGAFALVMEGDSIYQTLDGAWLNNESHAAIHRVASAGKCGGILAEVMRFCFTRAANLKIDTHPDNKIMQHLLEKLGFVRCGTVTYPAPVGLRIAYHGVKGCMERLSVQS